MKNTTIALSVLGFILAGYTTMAAYVVISQDIESLLICSDKPGVYKIPFGKNVCRAYLFNFRGTPEDIATLQKGIGASFVTGGESPLPERERVLKYLIGKGLDVNQIDMHGMLPLHGAVVLNSTDELEMLLRNGARPNLKDKRTGGTPLELAIKLKAKSKEPEKRQAVVSILERAK